MSSQHAAAPPAPDGIANRRLKPFPPPDLEVVVGSSQRIYRYHSIVLASLSTYVDTMLSSPMKERESKRISFPDIEPEMWEKAIRCLVPGYLTLPSLEDMCTLLPFYDKYQFEDGIKLCDGMLFTLLSEDRRLEFVGSDEYVQLVVLSHNLNLPRSRSRAVEFASYALSTSLCWKKEENIRQLLPLVENDSSTMVSLLVGLKGRHCRDMTLDEMRSVTKEDSFPKQCVERENQIRDQDGVLKYLNVSELCLQCLGERERQYLPAVNGAYIRRLGGDGCFSTFRSLPGALKYHYHKEWKSYDEHVCRVVLQAMDVFGLVWEIASFPGGDDGEDGDGDEATREEHAPKRQRSVLYRWDGGYSSLVPPKRGWEVVQEERPEVELIYDIDDSKNNYF